MKRPLHYSDNELLDGLISQNDEILQAYYRLYYHGIRKHVLYNHGREEDAKDLFQDVMLVIFQKVRYNSFVLKCSLSTYLFSVSKYLWLKELHKRKRIELPSIDLGELADSGIDIIEIADYNERMRIYHQHFERLSEHCRRVLSLFMEGKKISEITKIMDYKSDQHTRNRRYRCKMYLINKIRGIQENKENENGNDEED